MKKFIYLLSLLFCWSIAFSVDFYTTGASTDWSDGASWNQDGALPGASDRVFITHDINLNSSVSVSSLSINGAGVDLILGTGIVFSSGNVSVSGGTFQSGDNNDINISGTLSSINGGTVNFGDNSTVDITLNLSSSGDIVLIGTGTDLTVGGDFVFIGSGADLELESGATLDVTGDVSISGTSGTQNISGSISADNFIVFGGTQNVNILSGGSITTINDVSISGGGVYSLASGATLNVGDDMIVFGGASHGVVDGAIVVIDTIKVESTINNITGSGSVTAAYYVGLGTIFGTVANDIADGDTVLPIELAYFKAVVDGDNINVIWQTATEENNDYFTVERSVNGVDFKEIGYKKGANNSNVSLSYLLVDYPKQKGVYYYRLKQTDNNGDFTYSNVVSVDYSGIDKITGAEMFFNGSEVVVRLNDTYSIAKLSIYNIEGVVLVEKQYCDVSEFSLPINSNLGIVVAVVEYGTSKRAEKLYIDN